LCRFSAIDYSTDDDDDDDDDNTAAEGLTPEQTIGIRIQNALEG